MELSINGVSKKYKDKLAVNALSLELHDGIYGLLGPNGSGKTTLMRMLTTVSNPTGGSITLDGEDIFALGESYRDLLGYLPQNFGYYPNFTGRDFLMYFAALKGMTRFQAEERCDELLELTGLSHAASKKLRTYSGGMRQRIGIAQALLNDPKILILDEPTSGLDPARAGKIPQHHKQSFRQTHHTFVNAHRLRCRVYRRPHRSDEKRLCNAQRCCRQHLLCH